MAAAATASSNKETEDKIKRSLTFSQRATCFSDVSELDDVVASSFSPPPSVRIKSSGLTVWR